MIIDPINKYLGNLSNNSHNLGQSEICAAYFICCAHQAHIESYVKTLASLLFNQNYKL